MLSSSVDVNTTNIHDDTPLIYAAKNNNIEIAFQLLEAGARMDVFSVEMETPLFIATK
jgi:ankyrin repeat protein